MKSSKYCRHFQFIIHCLKNLLSFSNWFCRLINFFLILCTTLVTVTVPLNQNCKIMLFLLCVVWNFPILLIFVFFLYFLWNKINFYPHTRQRHNTTTIYHTLRVCSHFELCYLTEFVLCAFFMFPVSNTVTYKT